MSQQGQGLTEESAEVVSGDEQLVLPDVELTTDILNDVLLAEIALQRNQYDLAIKLYSRLAHETQDPRVAERATRIALFTRDYPAALKMAKLWMKLNSSDIEGRQILTALLIKEGDYDAALEELDQVLANVEDENERYMTIIRLLGREKDKEGPIEVVNRYLARHPDDVAGLYAYGQLALRAGKLVEAEASVERLLKKNPDWSQAAILKTRILQASNREAQALEYLGNVVNRRSKDTQLRISYGRMLVDSGRLEDALDQFKRVIKADPENDDIRFAAGLVAMRVDQVALAAEYFLDLNRRSVRVHETAYYLGRIAEVRQDFDDAIYWYGSVGRSDNYLNAQVRKALLQARQGDVDAARAHLNNVQALSPGQRLRLFLAEGEILRDVGQYEEALSVYDVALKEVPDNTELLYARAMVAIEVGKLDEMERDLLNILEREPDHVDALNTLGYTLADLTTRYDEAYVYIKRAYELRPDSFYIIDSLGWVKYRLGELDEAIKYLRMAMEKNPDPEIAAHLGEVLWVKGDREEARGVWQKALEVSPESKVLLNVINRLEK